MPPTKKIADQEPSGVADSCVGVLPAGCVAFAILAEVLSHFAIEGPLTTYEIWGSFVLGVAVTELWNRARRARNGCIP